MNTIPVETDDGSYKQLTLYISVDELFLFHLVKFQSPMSQHNNYLTQAIVRIIGQTYRFSSATGHRVFLGLDVSKIILI